MFMLSVYESVYLFQKWKENIFETEELKHKQLQNRLDSLKNQVNPHFLFNSLSSLSVLIREDKSKATAFVQEMAQVYRYILQSNENDLATVEKELQFVRSYMYLQRIRFDDNVKEVIEVPEEFLSYKLPSLTLQALIENAIKHNVVSAAKPLVIKINVDEHNHLIVCNNLQRKMQLVQMNNFGLANINKRYEMHGLHNPVVSESAKEFKVTLPLIPNTD
jgi:LytS/YehU family sensor histidine kinase